MRTIDRTILKINTQQPIASTPSSISSEDVAAIIVHQVLSAAIQSQKETNKENNTEQKNNPIIRSDLKFYIENSTLTSSKALHLIQSNDGQPFQYETPIRFNENECTLYNAKVKTENNKPTLKIWNQANPTEIALEATEAEIKTISKSLDEGKSVFVTDHQNSQQLCLRLPEQKSDAEKTDVAIETDTIKTTWQIERVPTQSSAKIYLRTETSNLNLINKNGKIETSKELLPNSNLTEYPARIEKKDNKDVLTAWSVNDKTVVYLYPTKNQLEVIDKTFIANQSILMINEKDQQFRLYKSPQVNELTTLPQGHIDFFGVYEDTLPLFIKADGKTTPTKKGIICSTDYEPVENTEQIYMSGEIHDLTMILQCNQSRSNEYNAIIKQNGTNNNAPLSLETTTISLSKGLFNTILNLKADCYTIYAKDRKGNQYRLNVKEQPHKDEK